MRLHAHASEPEHLASSAHIWILDPERNGATAKGNRTKPTSLLSTSPSLPPLSVAIAAVAIAVATVVARAVATVPLPLPPLQNIRRTRDVNRIWPATNLGNLRADCLSCGKPFYRCRRRCQIPRSSVSVSRNTCPALAVPLDGSTQARGMYITHVPHHFLRVALSQE